LKPFKFCPNHCEIKSNSDLAPRKVDMRKNS